MKAIGIIRVSRVGGREGESFISPTEQRVNPHHMGAEPSEADHISNMVCNGLMTHDAARRHLDNDVRC